MSILTLRLPKSLHENIKNLAKHEGISINQFLVSAAAEKMSALLTKDYLENEAKKGQRKDFEKVLALYGFQTVSVAVDRGGIP